VVRYNGETMKKLDSVIYNKLLLQAEEARDQGMVKLADAIVEAIGSEASSEKQEYTYNELYSDIHHDLWKIAKKLMIYYDVDSVDALKVDAAIISWMSKTIDEIEKELEVDEVVKGPLEPKLPGERE